jgi:hypothetical protein
MKIHFALIYIKNLIGKNPVKIIATVLLFVLVPFLNSLKDIKNIDKIDYQYQKDGKYFYITQTVSNNELSYDVKTFDKIPKIKNGYLITYSYNDGNILMWVAFIVLCLFPIVGIFTSDSDTGFDFEEVFQATISHFITCELEDGIYYYFYKDRFLGKSDRPLQEYNYIARSFRIRNMTNIKSCPKWKTKSQNRNTKIEELLHEDR